MIHALCSGNGGGSICGRDDRLQDLFSYGRLDVNVAADCPLRDILSLADAGAKISG